MKRFFKIFVFLLILTYVCMSIYGGSWDPVKWTESVRQGVVPILMLDGAIAFFINVMFD